MIWKHWSRDKNRVGSSPSRGLEGVAKWWVISFQTQWFLSNRQHQNQFQFRIGLKKESQINATQNQSNWYQKGQGSSKLLVSLFVKTGRKNAKPTFPWNSGPKTPSSFPVEASSNILLRMSLSWRIQCCQPGSIFLANLITTRSDCHPTCEIAFTSTPQSKILHGWTLLKMPGRRRGGLVNGSWYRDWYRTRFESLIWNRRHSHRQFPSDASIHWWKHISSSVLRGLNWG